MAKQVTIEGNIYLNLDYGVKPYEHEQFKFFPLSIEEFANFKRLRPHAVIFELPEGFDPRADQLARLEAQKKELQAQFTAAVTEINARINKLMAISNDVEVA